MNDIFIWKYNLIENNEIHHHRNALFRKARGCRYT